ncbi:type II toxin-antitoxin system VapC family toxin [Hymenobacter psoromatis]|uniref:type II toxin-antitoxin system VapC family toxin n=1 Tax=Hymenobacter psoromatis TaxID=1484116 RepID=UPI001CBAE4D2|nr:type II toxin-antitoxin system VapC family toxin [Hymenobacter psoromatis]
MSDFFCVDTDALIDFQRGDQIALRELAYLERAAPLSVSAIVRMELIIGSSNREFLQRTEKLLKRYQLLPLEAEIGALADCWLLGFSLGKGLRLADALIAATAVHHAAPLLTKNQRDFYFIPGLKLLPYPGTPA